MKDEILAYLKSDFERRFFLASIANLERHDDPLRFNSFAYSLRELVRNIFALRAPDEKVMACSWFKPETDNGLPTRQQRYIYCVQGGLSPDFVKNQLKFDPLAPWKGIKNSIDKLSKYTHVTESTFDICNEMCEEYAEDALESVLNIFYMASDAKAELIDHLQKEIDSELIGTCISNTMPDIDILSHSSYVEQTEVHESRIVSVDEREIVFEGNGTAYVSLNYGKGEDSCEINDDYPFTFTGRSSVLEPRKLQIPPENISIDVSSWFGDEPEDFDEVGMDETDGGVLVNHPELEAKGF